MDSMRSLNTSLPRTSPQRRNVVQQTPEDLLSAFKAAAMSVTTLYKAAAQEQHKARAAGYQDALDDLLTFLDKENMGLGDGEGWRVRQWATERFDGSAVARAEDDDDEEGPPEEEKPRSMSPETTKETQTQAARQTAVAEETQRVSQQHVQAQAQAATEQPNTEHQTQQVRFPNVPPAFVFESSHPYPTNHDREINMDGASVTSEASSLTQDVNTEAPVRVEYVPKGSTRSRQNRQTNNNRSTSGRVTLGAGAGSKRKPPFGDFFDISGLSFDGNSRDGHDRGGKRGRHV